MKYPLHLHPPQATNETQMNRSPSSSTTMFPLPGSPASSWAVYKQRFKAVFAGADTSVLVAFWLFGTYCSTPFLPY
jgi:hypothetical protein